MPSMSVGKDNAHDIALSSRHLQSALVSTGSHCTRSYMTRTSHESWCKERVMATKAADVLVETLAQAGVERVYGVAGDSLNGIMDALRSQEHMRWMHMR